MRPVRSRIIHGVAGAALVTSLVLGAIPGTAVVQAAPQAGTPRPVPIPVTVTVSPHAMRLPGRLTVAVRTWRGERVTVLLQAPAVHGHGAHVSTRVLAHGVARVPDKRRKPGFALFQATVTLRPMSGRGVRARLVVQVGPPDHTVVHVVPVTITAARAVVTPEVQGNRVANPPALATPVATLTPAAGTTALPSVAAPTGTASSGPPPAPASPLPTAGVTATAVPTAGGATAVPATAIVAPPPGTAVATSSPTPPAPTVAPPTATITPGAEQVVTLADNGQMRTFSVGERFLVELDTSYVWTITIDDPSIVGPSPTLEPIPQGAQGEYVAKQPGQTVLRAAGNPVCYPGCGLPSRLYVVTLAVH